MPQNHPEWQKHFATLPDTGPLYTETNLSNFIVEPWNAATSLAFLLPAIYWAYFLRKDYKEYWFLIYCSVLLFIGGTGSTLFHALRSSKFLITLDFLPMAIATFSICIYFWHKLLKKWHWVLLIVLPFFALRYLIFNHLGHHNSINASYFLSGVLFFIPLLLLLFKNNWQNSTFALASLVSFVVSLFFRQIDAYDPPLFSIGTHFLWHLFGALGAHFIAVYIYKLERSSKTYKIV